MLLFYLLFMFMFMFAEEILEKKRQLLQYVLLKRCLIFCVVITF